MALNLKKISAKDAQVTMRAAVHRSGKLGFSSESNERMGLKEGRGIILYVDPNDQQSLYFQVVDLPNEEAFKINKGGKYYYAQTKDFFDYIEMEYGRETIRFNIREITDNGTVIYRLKRRIKPERRMKKDRARNEN